MIRKVCAFSGCEDLAEPGQRHCHFHAQQERERQALRKAKVAAREISKTHNALYATKAWKRASKAYLKRNPLCADCLSVGITEAATEVDHIEPHRGDKRKFWLRSNWQSLCHSCHSRKTAREVFAGHRG